jgi:hypothetical protein
MCAEAMLSGAITEGDARRLEDLIQANMPLLGSLALNSRGGSVSEAIEVGRVVHRYYLWTQAPSTLEGKRPHYWLWGKGRLIEVPDAICASACFFVWLGGVNRSGDRVGIHRPLPPPDEMRKLSPVEAERLYHDLSDKVLRYFAELDVSPHWMSDMMRIASDDIYIIPEDQRQRELDGNWRDFNDLPSFAEWKRARCGALSIQEWDDLVTLSHSADHKLPTRMSDYKDYLDSRVREITECGREAVLLARWQLRFDRKQD